MKLSVMLSGASFGALMLGSAAVSAATVDLKVCSGDICWNGNDYEIADAVRVDWSNVETLVNANGKSVNDWESANGLDMSGWALTMDSDPYVSNAFAITNTTASTQTYTVTATLGVAPAILNGLMRGSAGFSLTDNNGDGATLATSGASIYTGTIDGNIARTLWDSPSPASYPFVISFGSSANSATFGFPAREPAPYAIGTDIGIQIKFSLTPYDSASFTSNFDVVPVPVPAAVWLFGSGLLGLFGLSRRKRH